MLLVTFEVVVAAIYFQMDVKYNALIINIPAFHVIFGR